MFYFADIFQIIKVVFISLIFVYVKLWKEKRSEVKEKLL